MNKISWLKSVKNFNKDKNLQVPDDCKTIMIKNFPAEYNEESL